MSPASNTRTNPQRSTPATRMDSVQRSVAGTPARLPGHEGCTVRASFEGTPPPGERLRSTKFVTDLRPMSPPTPHLPLLPEADQRGGRQRISHLSFSTAVSPPLYPAWLEEVGGVGDKLITLSTVKKKGEGELQIAFSAAGRRRTREQRRTNRYGGGGQGVGKNGSVAKVRNMYFGGRAKRSKKVGRKRLSGRPKRI